jgi:putative endonuclease
MFNPNYYVYFLTNVNKKTLYIGVTNDLERRLKEHNMEPKGFVKKYNCNYLIYFEHFSNIVQAIDREKKLKKWGRKKKDWLISTSNPRWDFLNSEFIVD